jgi:hypothetical protein
MVFTFALGALLAAAGTRLAAGAFVAAAVLGARSGGPMAPVATWTAALAAGWVLLEPGSVRRIGRPALGAVAVIAAGLSSNGAVVGGLWVIGTAAAVFGSDSEDAPRWSFGLCLADLLVLGVVASTMLQGFEGWPSTIGTPAAAALLASAVLRIPLAAGPATDALAGLLVVRTQVIVLTTLAVSAGGTSIARAAIVAGSLAFATAVLSRRPQLVDASQELALYMLAIAATTLAWSPDGWMWGALASGTLIHHLRLIVGRGTAGQWAKVWLRSGGLGVVFLPVVASLLEGSAGARGWPAAVVAIGLLVGLAGRARTATAPARRGGRRRTTTGSELIVEEVRAAAVAICALAAAVWAPVLALPRSIAGTPVGWPPVWAVVGVAAAGVAGAFLTSIVPKRAVVPASIELPGRLRVPQTPLPWGNRTVWAGIGACAVVAAVLWILGLTRGFL